MEVALRVEVSIRWTLVKAHGVREAGRKQAIVEGGELLEDVRQAALLGRFEVQEAAEVSAGQDQGFEGPHCPEGHQDGKFLVLANDALLLLQLDFQIGRASCRERV